MAIDTRQQRALILGAALELMGIGALAVYFFADRGGAALSLAGTVLVVAGIGLQVRGLLSRR